MKTSVSVVRVRQQGPDGTCLGERNIDIRTEENDLKTKFLQSLIKSGSLQMVPAQLLLEVLEDREKWKKKAQG